MRSDSQTEAREMTTYTLHGRGESGNVYKAALMLNLCGLDWQPKLVGFFDPGSKSAFSAAVNEMGEVPVLEFNGRRLSQTGVILTACTSASGGKGRPC